MLREKSDVPHPIDPAQRFARRRLTLAVGTALLLLASVGSAQSFDPSSPEVLQAYNTPLTSAKIDPALAGPIRILPVIAQFPGLLPNPPIGGGGAGFVFFQGGGPGFIPGGFAYGVTHGAGSDSDLAALGNPVVLSD